MGGYKGGRHMKGDKKIISDGFAPVYKEISDIIGAENTYALYKSMRGVQISFPKRLYDTEFILNEMKNVKEEDFRKLALKYDYTEKYLRQLLREKTNLTKEKEGG